ncbi:hypothetical protein V8E51_005200 [Hyaloscypha variabilis]
MKRTCLEFRTFDYVRDFIDNIRDAPDDLRRYNTEISSFRSAVLGFQEILQAIKPFARIDNSAEQALLALQSGGTVIDESKAFLQNFEQSRERELWRSIKLTRKRSELAKYVARLGEAKVNILLAQSQVNLSTSTVVLSQTTQVQNSILDLKKSTSDKFEELTAMQNMLSERLDILGVVLGPMVKVAVSNTVVEVHADLEETRKYGRLDSSPLNLADPAYSTYRQQIGPSTSTGHQRPSKNTRAARQIRYERTFCLWFATITLQSRSTATQEMLSSKQNERGIHETTSTRIRVNIRPNSWILRKGVLAFFERQLGGTSLGADMRLRVYRIVSCYSPIARACRSGDFATAYSLFQSGQASVFDIVEEFNESLLDHTWRWLKASIRFGFCETVVEPKVVRDGLLETFKFLTTHGLDPGDPARPDKGECQMSRIQQIFECTIADPDSLTSYVVEIIRVIIINSRQNPFDIQSRYQGPLIKLACEMRPELAACIRSQEQWCIQGCFEEDHTFHIKPGDHSMGFYFGGPMFPFWEKSLVGDPDAIYLRAILHSTVTPCYLPSICQNNLINSRTLIKDLGGCWDHAVKARVYLDTVANDRATLVEFFASYGSINILEAAWLELGDDLESFYANFEGEIICAIVRDLDALRPARQWRQPKVWDRRQDIYDHSSSVFFDQAYRKFFPDDEEEIEEIGFGFDAVTFYRRRRGNLEDDFEPSADDCAEFNSNIETTESLLAVNGLTEEFWD